MDAAIDAAMRSSRESGSGSRTKKFNRGDRVRKVGGSQREGIVVGEYSTNLTPEGYAVESFTHAGSVQIYPAKALEFVSQDNDCAGAGHAKQQEAEEAAAPTYSYSTDGETFYGTFATPEAAAADYLRNGDDDSSVEVGRNERRTANDYVGKHHIESLLEMVGENAYEECGDCAESWLSDMTKDTDQLTELKRVVGDWIQRNDPPGFWHVEDIRRITRAELIASGHLAQPSKVRYQK